MSSWLHLRSDILLEFYEQGRMGRRKQTFVLEIWLAERDAERAARYEEELGLWRRQKRTLLHQSVKPKCETCGLSIPPRAGGRYVWKYCSKFCLMAVHRVRLREQRKAQRRALLATRPCLRCGQPVSDGVRVTKRFCSDACSLDAARERKRERMRLMRARGLYRRQQADLA